MKAIRVLVTGAGSGVGQGIMKALRLTDLPVTIVACDIGPLNAGLYRADESALVRPVESAGALDATCDLIRERDIDVVMIGSEFDLAFYARHRVQIEERTSAMVCVSALETVDVADDKFKTTEFLRRLNLPHARAMLPINVDEAVQAAKAFGLPVVLKSCTGTSSRNVHIIRDLARMERLFPTVPNPMIQEFAGREGDDLGDEYTCSVFTCSDGAMIGPFTARRTLRGGTSWLVEVDQFAWLHDVVLQIARNLSNVGSINVQMRDGPRGPIPFEINARFSGTTAIRAHFGFNEPEMFLKSWFLGQAVPTPPVRKGLVLRYVEEVFLEDVSSAALAPPLPHGTVRSWF